MLNRIKTGLVAPLGASVQVIDGVCGMNVALYSAHASNVELCLYSHNGNERRFAMNPNAHDENGTIWTIWLANVALGIRYGFRVYGEHNPHAGHYFNPQKVLLDPYAKAVAGKPHFADDEQVAWFDINNNLNNQAVAPKAVFIDDEFDWQGDVAPNRTWAETVIYELHVKGFSQRNPAVPKMLRGSYAGLGHAASIDYLKKLGITAVELLPVAYHADEQHLQRKGLRNYWGYNLLAPFAVESDYWSGQPNSTPLSEFKAMVKALHAANIEVILDVVFNHTADSDAQQPTLSLQGIDNKSYYWLNEQGDYHNWSGCGNVLNVSNPPVRDWVLDCLRYWVGECHVDGFRFDLGAVLGREPHFNRYAEIFQQIAADPLLKDKKYIAEPWDIGWGGYQLGNFPDYFAEWNDRFRDDMRRFWLYHDGNLGGFAQRFCASADIFQHDDKYPSASINYICSHDGFTLKDLVSYQDKHNWANGEENRDGHGENFSQNFGVEGETEQPEIVQQRQMAVRALLATALFANGTPMLMAGDEIGHSQQGNNNAYCQDNEITWIDWNNADQDLLAYTQALIAARKQITALSQQNNWWDDRQVRWWNGSGEPMSVADWQDPHSNGFQIELEQRWLLVINRGTTQAFRLPPCGYCNGNHNGNGNWEEILAPTCARAGNDKEVIMLQQGMTVFARRVSVE